MRQIPDCLCNPNSKPELEIKENGRIEQTFLSKIIKTKEADISESIKSLETTVKEQIKEGMKNPLFGKEKHREKEKKLADMQEIKKKKINSLEEERDSLKMAANKLDRTFDLLRYNPSLKEIIMQNKEKKMPYKELLGLLNSKIEEMKESNKLPDQIQSLYSKIKNLEKNFY
jgi:hypothetical protein